MKNILIIRFSSFGDIVQALSITKLINHKYPEAQIDWLTKSDFIYLPDQCPYVNNTISLRKEDGILGLIRISLALRSKNYDLVYDAHSNLRSFIIKFILKFFNFQTKFVTRSKERWKRILLFKFRKNRFPSPYRGMLSFVEPLKIEMSDQFNLKQDWNFKKETIDIVHEKVPFIDEAYIVMAPSAAWEMKRWPVEHWRNLQRELSDFPLVLVGGPADHFISQIVDPKQKKCLNLAGQLNLIESSYLVSKARLVISADTGIIHVADLLGVSGLSLIGPTAFGFPTNDNIKTLEVELPCRPCSKDGRGSCERNIYQECMVNISVDTVKAEALKFLE